MNKDGEGVIASFAAALIPLPAAARTARRMCPCSRPHELSCTRSQHREDAEVPQCHGFGGGARAKNRRNPEKEAKK